MPKTKKWFTLSVCMAFLFAVHIGVFAASAAQETLPPLPASNSCGESVQTLDELVALGRKGDVLISATNVSGFNWLDFSFYFRHGHAAIVYSEDEIIHCWGAGTVSDLTTLLDFGEAEQVRLYTVSGVSDEEAAQVADYAKNHLLGIPYSFAADAFSTNTLNCTTIVYHAYANETDVALNKILYTVSPESFVQDGRTLCLGNISWQGDPHSFDNEAARRSGAKTSFELRWNG